MKLNPDISYKGVFRDEATFDPVTKTAVSVRDGTLRYTGQEIGLEPADASFTVYRSPATIANAAMKMLALPVTFEHVSLDQPAPNDNGFVEQSNMIDLVDVATNTTLAIKNKLMIGDSLTASIDAGKRELSLGYNADLIPCEGEFDFEQVNITPHHLAVVDKGRCGPICSFLDRISPADEDKNMIKLHKAFTDAEGAMNLQQIVELSAALPEAIKAVPVDQLTKLLPALKQIVEAAKSVLPAETEGTISEGDTTTEKETLVKDETENQMSDETEEEKEKKFSDAVSVRADELVAVKLETIEKARSYLPDSYNFADKQTAEIMRDALKTQLPDKFSDGDLPLAFKMLRPVKSRYQDFGDSDQSNQFAAVGEKEL